MSKPAGEVAITEAQPFAPAPAPSGVRPPNTVRRERTVIAGDTLSDIATQYGVAQTDLMVWNGLSGEDIQPGQKLVVYVAAAAKKAPAATKASAATKAAGEKTKTHTVTEGENISGIARKYKTTVKKLVELNQLDNPEHIEPGQRLLAPARP